MLHPRIWVVIPSFNALPVTRSCLTDVCRQTYPNFKVILSDSGSTDGTFEVIGKEFPQVVMVRGNPDWWWTKATNEGIQLALGQAGADDYIMTLNNDIVMPQGYLGEMMSRASQYPGSIVGSVIYDTADQGHLVECGSYIDWRTMKYHFLSPTDFDQRGHCEKLTFLCGKGVLYPICVFREHGLFDEARLPHYGADQDFVASCKEWGYPIRVQTHIPLYSYEEITAVGARDVTTLPEKLKLLFRRKSKLNLRVHMHIMLRHCPRRYRATNAVLLTARLLGHIFLKKGEQHGPMRGQQFTQMSQPN